MARIPDSELERLKKEVAIERLVMGLGVELKRHGAELVGTCPFHDDKTPSLVVSPKTNPWHCLGACNVGGSTIDWVMKTKGVSFRHARSPTRWPATTTTLSNNVHCLHGGSNKNGASWFSRIVPARLGQCAPGRAAKRKTASGGRGLCAGLAPGGSRR